MTAALVDIIIPTISGRENSLDRCVAAYEAAGGGANIIIVRDEPTCGMAWIEGLKQSNAPFVHLSCDDLEVLDAELALASAIEVAVRDELPAPTVYRPDGTIESCGGDLSAADCLISSRQPPGTETDFTVVPFMARTQAEKIGMIPAHYLCDTWVSYRGRQLGYSTVIAEHYEFVHHHEMVGRRSAVTPEDRRLFTEGLA